ncbi:guanine deaminase [Betaproteobacteria bacterium]|nr:guanine deaminase [Betaproteobacteria bacterium]
MPTPLLAVRGEIIHFTADPATHGAAAHEHLPDGLLLIAAGHVLRCGPAAQLQSSLPTDTRHLDYRGKLILPGFIDTHVHYAQTGMIASYGEQLGAWLEKYAFPAERGFADPAHAAAEADFFCDQLLRNGTTTAMAFATVHPAAVDALFAVAHARRMRLIAGKVLMDRNCPLELSDDSAAAGDAQSRALIEKWHGRDRLAYAITPRFAPTSTPEQLRRAGQLFTDHPGLHLQTHLAEQRAEVAWVAQLYPAARSYLDVYERHALLGARSLFAHCIWLDDDDRRHMAAHGAAMSFCPTSNLFLGSGLFDLAAADRCGVRVGLGTDIGAGTSFSLLQTLNEAYKVLQLSGQSLTPERAFYLATLGGARSLYLDDKIGSFAAGREADFVVLDPLATPLLTHRMAHATTLAERLFVLMMLGDERCVVATHVLGEVANHD